MEPSNNNNIVSFDFTSDNQVFQNHIQQYQPQIPSKIKTKPINIQNEAQKGKLPSPVLTKQNSKIWTKTDFNEYEKELKQQLSHLQSQQMSVCLYNMYLYKYVN